jgi:hypothetical protein
VPVGSGVGISISESGFPFSTTAQARIFLSQSLLIVSREFPD